MNGRIDDNCVKKVCNSLARKCHSWYVCVFRVAECTECKMPASNLAKVFGPTIVGYSSTEAEPMKMFAETTKQAKVRLVLDDFVN